MTVNNTSSSGANAAATDSVAKPLAQLSRKQREKVTSELLRIHNLVSSVAEGEMHKDVRGDKADRDCAAELKKKKNS